MIQLKSTITVVTDNITNEVAETLAAGDPIPSDLGVRIHTGKEGNTIIWDEVNVLSDVIRLLQERREQTIANTAGKALVLLGKELDRCMADVATTATTLDGVTTAEQAIRVGGKAPANLQRMLTLVDTYTEIRTAQRALMTRPAHFPTWEEYHEVGITREPCDPAFLVATGKATAPDSRGNGRVIVPTPWPGYAPTGSPTRFIPSTDPIGYLTWLADRGDAWIPTEQELSRAVAHREFVIRVNRLDITEQERQSAITAADTAINNGTEPGNAYRAALSKHLLDVRRGGDRGTTVTER